MSEQQQHFTDRLAAALEAARARQSGPAPVQPAGDGNQDTFTDRLRTAAVRARQDETPPTETPAESTPSVEPGAPHAATPQLGPVAKVARPPATEQHTIRDGDSITSLAFRFGFYPNTIWDDPANADLRNERIKPNVLHPGDVVWIPEKVRKDVPGKQTEQRHRFRRRGCPEKFRLQLKAYGDPRANEEYVLEIDGQIFSGTTDAEGWLEHDIPPGARRGVLRVRPGEEYALQLGHLSPVTTDEGVVDRLINLGYLTDEHRRDEQRLAAALEDFQLEHGLEANGRADEATREKLVELYGC